MSAPRISGSGALRAVYHGSQDRVTLKELARTYQNVVEDATRVMLHLKALFRARAIKAAGKSVYHPKNRAEWLGKLRDRGVRYRAETLYAQLDVLRELRPKVKAAMVAEARRDPAWAVLGSIPFLGPVRVALLLATMRTPWRFRWSPVKPARFTLFVKTRGLCVAPRSRRTAPKVSKSLRRRHVSPTRTHAPPFAEPRVSRGRGHLLRSALSASWRRYSKV
ncbi:MAG: hypothetical protein EXR91_12795 [Gemmatimonadetes bacterium]|nr:hypothetical protein [Gemmatimonadota bacterium]